jgi:hypothetical protein
MAMKIQASHRPHDATRSPNRAARQTAWLSTPASRAEARGRRMAISAIPTTGGATPSGVGSTFRRLSFSTDWSKETLGPKSSRARASSTDGVSNTPCENWNRASSGRGSEARRRGRSRRWLRDFDQGGQLLKEPDLSGRQCVERRSCRRTPAIEYEGAGVGRGVGEADLGQLRPGHQGAEAVGVVRVPDLLAEDLCAIEKALQRLAKQGSVGLPTDAPWNAVSAFANTGRSHNDANATSRT